MSLARTHDPHDLGKRLPKYAKHERDEQFLLELNDGLQGISFSMPDPTPVTAHLPILYIVGVPRSGTTLLSQLVSRYLPMGYINNLIARFWLRPSVGIALSRSLFGDRAREGITFNSSYGTTQEATGPHEFGYFWRRWLALDEARTHHLPADALAVLDHQGLKRALEHEILGAFERPVVFKNVICGFHAAFLTQLHPASLFIHITRDRYAAASSILEARIVRYGSYETWWSLKPSSFPFNYSGDPAAEVAQQVLHCRREFENELSRPGVQSMAVTYEQLCANPGSVVDRIGERVRAFGVSCERLPDSLPQLSPTPPSPIPDHLRRRLEECLTSDEEG